MSANKPNHDYSWRSINGDGGCGPEVPEDFSFRAFIHDRGVLLGIAASIIGIAIAGLAIYIPSGGLQMASCIAGACVSFAGVSQITKYINRCTVREAQKKKTKK